MTTKAGTVTDSLMECGVRYLGSILNKLLLNFRKLCE